VAQEDGAGGSAEGGGRALRAGKAGETAEGAEGAEEGRERGRREEEGRKIEEETWKRRGGDGEKTGKRRRRDGEETGKRPGRHEVEGNPDADEAQRS
jgi:hypothetical protein